MALKGRKGEIFQPYRQNNALIDIIITHVC